MVISWWRIIISPGHGVSARRGCTIGIPVPWHGGWSTPMTNWLINYQKNLRCIQPMWVLAGELDNKWKKGGSVESLKSFKQGTSGYHTSTFSFKLLTHLTEFKIEISTNRIPQHLRLPMGPDSADLLGGGPPLRTGGPLFIGGGPLDDIPLKKVSRFPELS